MFENTVRKLAFYVFVRRDATIAVSAPPSGLLEFERVLIRIPAALYLYYLNEAAGFHTKQLNADNIISATYLIRMEAGDLVANQRVVFVE